MIGRTNSGTGGTSIIGSGSVPLRVSAPSGTKSVTATKDGVATRAKEVDGLWIFDGLSVGIWTIALDVNGTTKEVEYSVEIPEIGVALELTLYDNGDIVESSGGFSLNTYGGTALTESTYNGVVNIRGQSDSAGAYLTNKIIDVSGFKALQYKCGRGGNGTVNVVLMPVGATSVDDAEVSKSVTIFNTTPTQLEEMDISGITGKYQIGVSVKGSSGTINCYIAYMHLK